MFLTVSHSIQNLDSDNLEMEYVLLRQKYMLLTPDISSEGWEGNMPEILGKHCWHSVLTRLGWMDQSSKLSKRLDGPRL